VTEKGRKRAVADKKAGIESTFEFGRRDPLHDARRFVATSTQAG
jgi:hypothetical protein